MRVVSTAGWQLDKWLTHKITGENKYTYTDMFRLYQNKIICTSTFKVKLFLIFSFRFRNSFTYHWIYSYILLCLVIRQDLHRKEFIILYYASNTDMLAFTTMADFRVLCLRNGNKQWASGDYKNIILSWNGKITGHIVVG